MDTPEEPYISPQQAEERIKEIEQQLTEVVPQLQAELQFLRGWLVGNAQRNMDEEEPTPLRRAGGKK